MPNVLRAFVLMLMVCGLVAVERTAVLTMDDLYGRWQPDVAAMDATLKKDAVVAIKAGEEWSVTLTPRVGRLICGDISIAGMWRLDNATAKGGTLVIEPKGSEAQRFTVTFDGKHLFVEALPWKLPFVKPK